MAAKSDTAQGSSIAYPSVRPEPNPAVRAEPHPAVRPELVEGHRGASTGSARTGGARKGFDTSARTGGAGKGFDAPARTEGEVPSLLRKANTTLAEQLAQRVQERIRAHVYAPGARLPSVRAASAAQGVSAATVVAAYELLVAQGWVVAKPQKGFFVRAEHAFFGSNHRSVQAFTTTDATATIAYKARADLFTAAPQGTGQPVPATPLPTHANALIRGMFRPGAQHAARAQPSAGVLPSPWLDNTFMASAVRHVAGQMSSFALEYGDPQGDLGLREALSQRLSAFAIPCPAQHIVTTAGATHALDVASRTLLRPGDAVMVEEPGWTVEFARLAALGMRVLPVPRGPTGPDVETMQRYCTVADPALRPKLFVCVSVLHNPTGVSISPAAAHQVLQLAHAHNFYVLEDDTYAHFAPEHATRIAALDAARGLQRVIYVGGFAKALAPNWRVGFLAAPTNLVERIADTKMLTTLTTSAFLEKTLARIIGQGHLRKHCERLKTELDAARSRSVKLAIQAGCSFAAEPQGLFGWVDVGCDTERLSERMLDAGYLLAPGGLFYAERRPTTLMRVNFASTQAKQFWDALEAARSEI